MKPIIVGVDPGIYVGIAVFDLSQNLLSAVTLTNPGKEGVVAEIAKHGTPIAIASDVSPAPEFVMQIASYFNARLVHPKDDMLEKDKTEMASPFKPDSAHERDAIAAVIHLFRQYTNTFRRIDRLLTEQKATEHSDRIKRCVIGGIPATVALEALKLNAESLYVLPESERDEGTRDERRQDQRGKSGQENRDKLLLEMLEANTKLKARISLLEAETTALARKVKEISSGDFRRIEKKHSQEREYHMRKIEQLRLLLKEQKAEFRAKLKNIGEKTKAEEVKEAVEKEEGSRRTATKGDKKKPTLDNDSLESMLDEYRDEREDED